MQSSRNGKTTNGGRRRRDGKTSGGEEAHVPAVEVAAACWARGRGKTPVSRIFESPVRVVRMNCESRRVDETQLNPSPETRCSVDVRYQSKSGNRSIVNVNLSQSGVQDMGTETLDCPEPRSDVRRNFVSSREGNMQRKRISALKEVLSLSVREKSERARGGGEINSGGRTDHSGCSEDSRPL